MGIFLLALLVFSSITVNADSSGKCGTATELNKGTSHHTLTLKWYRMDDHELLNEEDIPGSCIFIKYPIWATGSFPVNEGEESILDGCVKRPGNDCDNKYNITVHNCGEYNVYYLNATATTDEAYCFKKDDDDDDDDDDCEEQKEHYGKKFHRCHRNNRYVVLVIGSVIIAGVLISMVAIYLWRRKRLAALLKKEMYKAPQDSNGPVVVTTNDNLPPKKY